MRERCRCGDGQEGADHSGQRDRGERATQPRHPDVQPAFEKNDGEGDGDDSLDNVLRRGIQVRDQGACQRRAPDEQRRSGDLDALADPVGQDRKQPDRRRQRDQRAERSYVVHSGLLTMAAALDTSPTRLPGTPMTRLGHLRCRTWRATVSELRAACTGRSSYPSTLTSTDGMSPTPSWFVLLVFIGGCAGGFLRYVVTRHWPEPAGGFPWATFAVNVAGAF